MKPKQTKKTSTKPPQQQQQPPPPPPQKRKKSKSTSNNISCNMRLNNHSIRQTLSINLEQYTMFCASIS